MAFRIHRGLWQFQKADGNYETKYKINDSGVIVQTDTSGNEVSGLTASSVAWSSITGIPSTFTPSAHNHDGSYVPFSNLGDTFGLNDNKLYLRTKGDANHYLWNADDDWEELVYYTGTGFRIKGSTGTTPAYFTNSGIYASAYRGKDNVSGTGTASYHPDGAYVNGTMWQYGVMHKNNTDIQNADRIYANIFYDKANTSYYVDPASSSFLNSLSANSLSANSLSADSLSARYYTQSANGVPSNNLGSPTITEMALFNEQFNNKTAFLDPSRVTVWKQQTDGAEWEDITANYGETAIRRFIAGYDTTGNIFIPNAVFKFRIEVTHPNYVFANAVYFYWSSNSHNTTLHLWARRTDDNIWYQRTSSNTNVSSWPGHLYMPFSTIPWHPSANSSGHFNTLRFEFKPNWSTGTYSDRNIDLYKMQVWGGYPAGTRFPYSVNEFGDFTSLRNLSANGIVYATGGNSNNWNTAYSWGNHASAGYATTSYVTTQINSLINGAPGVLNTLDELASALGDDANFATNVTNSIAAKLPLAGGTMSGNLVLKSISGTDQMVENTYGAYLHLGAWGTGRTASDAILVNTAYRADYADSLFNMNISRFTNDSGYLTSLPSHSHSSISSGAGDITLGSATWTKNNGEANVAGQVYNGQSGDSRFMFHSGAGVVNVYTDGNFYAVEGTQKVATETWVAGRGYLTSVPAQSWSSITGKPTSLSQFTNDLGNYGGFLTSVPAQTWASITGKPSTFAPSSHTHSINEVTGLQSALDSKPVKQDGARYSTDWNNLLSSGFYNGEGTPANAPVSYGQLIVAKGTDTALQIAGGYSNDNLFFRGQGYGPEANGFYPWRKVIHDGNIGSQSVNYASGAGNADTTDGLHVHGGRNNEGNKIVRTDGNGYIQAGWINTPSGATTSTLTKIYASQDDYLRYVTPAEFRRQITDGVYQPAGSYAASSHTHDDRYYTETEVNNLLSGKQDAGSYFRENEDRRLKVLRFTGEGGDSGNSSMLPYAIYQEGGAWTNPYPNLRINMHTGMSFGANASYGGYRFMSDYNTNTIVFSVNDGDANVRVTNNLYIGSAGGWITDLLNGKQAAGSYAAASHTHDDRYYTETEVNSLLSGKQDAGSYAASSHSHDDRYYTETEVDSLLAGKQAAGSYAASDHNHTYNVNDNWLRENGDNNNFRIYGNSRQVIFRTDGVGGGEGHTGYPFKWTYGGDATGNTIMLLHTDGRLWTSRYGWIDTAFQAAGSYAAASHNHAISQVTGLQGALDGKQAAGSYLTSLPAHTHDDRYYTESESDARFATAGQGAKADTALQSLPSHTHTPSEVGLGNVSNAAQVTTSYNSSLNSDSRNSRGVTRLYRRDSDSDYSVQTYWTGARWRLYGYNGDSNHADTHVGYADSAGSASSASSATTATNVNNGNVYTTGNNLYIKNGSANNYRIHHTGTVGVFDVTSQFSIREMTSIWSAARFEWGNWMSHAWFDVDPWGDNWGIGSRPTSWKTVNRGSFLTFGFEDWSDRRHKSAIVEIDNAVDKVKAISGYTYWKKGSEVREGGVIAQDVLTVFPEGTGGTEEGYSVKPAALIGLLMKAVKEQQEIIDSLTARIELLENK